MVEPVGELLRSASRSGEVAKRFYLRVPEELYAKAAATDSTADLAQNLTQTTTAVENENGPAA